MNVMEGGIRLEEDLVDGWIGGWREVFMYVHKHPIHVFMSIVYSFIYDDFFARQTESFPLS